MKRLAIFLLTSMLAVAGYHYALTADISASNWSQTDASNNSAAPNGAPEGMAPSGVNDVIRANMGALKRFWDRANGTIASTGSANAYVLSYTVAPSAYTTGEVFTFRANFANTTTATVNINTLGAKEIKKIGTSGVTGLAANDIVSTQVVTIVYDGTQFQITSPIANVSTVSSASESVEGIAKLASDAEAVAATDTTKILTVAKASGWIGRTTPPGGRLTLTSGLAVTTTDITAATAIYYTPHIHNLVALWNATRWQVIQFAELTLSLDSNAGHTGYHQLGKIYDLFLVDTGGGIKLASGPAWTNDTTRANAIAQKDGRWTNSGAITLRYGTAAGDTASIAANLALYVGTFRASANGTTGDEKAHRFVWNAYNRARRVMRNYTETTDLWSYATATWRQSNANTNNQIEFVIGLSEDVVTATAIGICTNSNSAATTTGIGLDVTNAIASDSYPGSQQGATTAGASYVYSMTAVYEGFPGIGRHYLSWLEYADANATTASWKGDNALATTYQAGIVGVIMN